MRSARALLHVLCAALLLCVAARASAQGSKIVLVEFKYWTFDAHGDVSDRPTVASLKAETSVLSEIKQVLPCCSFVTRSDIKNLIAKDRERVLAGRPTEMDDIAAKFNYRYLLFGTVTDYHGRVVVGIRIIDRNNATSCCDASAPLDSTFMILLAVNRSGICPWKGEITVSKVHDTNITMKEDPPSYSVPIGGGDKVSAKCFYTKKSDWKEIWKITMKGKPRPDFQTSCFAHVSADGTDIEKHTQKLQNILCWTGDGNGVYPASLDYLRRIETTYKGSVDVPDVLVLVLMDQFGHYSLEVSNALSTAPCSSHEIEKKETSCESTKKEDGPHDTFFGIDGNVSQKLVTRNGYIVAVGDIRRNTELKATSLNGKEDWTDDGVKYTVTWDLKK